MVDVPGCGVRDRRTETRMHAALLSLPLLLLLLAPGRSPATASSTATATAPYPEVEPVILSLCGPVADPLAEGVDPVGGVQYYVVISNPTEVEMPYYFVVQTIQDGGVSEMVKFTDQLAAGRVRYLPLKLTLEDGVLSFELFTFSRQHSGKLNP